MVLQKEQRVYNYLRPLYNRFSCTTTGAAVNMSKRKEFLSMKQIHSNDLSFISQANPGVAYLKTLASFLQYTRSKDFSRSALSNFSIFSIYLST